MRKLLKIPTSVQQRISLEERRDPASDPDVIQLDPPVEQPVVDDGVGSIASDVVPENTLPVDGDVSPLAPAAVEGEPEAVTDPSTVPSPDVEPPAAVAEIPPTDEPGGSDPAVTDTPPVEPPAVEEPVPPAEPAVEPAATEPQPEPTPEPAPADDTPPVDPSLPPDVTDDVPPLTTTDVPGAEPAPTTDGVEPPATGDEPVPPTEPTPDVPPVGEAPVVEGEPGVTEPVPPADSANPDVPPVEGDATPVPDTDKITDEMTSAWVDGVSVDAEEVKQHLDEAAEQVVDADNTVEELRDAAVALEELHEVVSASLADANPIVSETTVNLVKVEAEKSLEKIGEVLNVPSMESPQSAQVTLQITLEAISSKLKEIWEAIKVALAKAWEAVKKFFNSIFDSAERVKTNIGKLRTALAALKANETPNAAEITEPSIVNAVGFDKFTTAAALAGNVEKMNATISPFLENSKTAVHTVFKDATASMIDVLSTDMSDDDKADKLGSQFIDVFVGYSAMGAKLATNIADGARKETETMFNVSGVVSIDSGPLPGGYMLSATDFTSKEGEFTSNHFQSLARGQFIQVVRLGTTLKKVPVADEPTLSAVLDSLESMIGAVITSKGSVAQFERDIAELRATVDRAINSIADAESIKASEVNTFLSAISNLGPSIVRQNATLCEMVVTVSNNVVKYVSACAKLYPSFGEKPIEGEVATA